MEHENLDANLIIDKDTTKSFLIKQSVILIVVAGVLYLPSMLFAMAADAPLSVGSIMFAWSGILFSPMCVLAVTLAWIAFGLHQYVLSRYLLGLPFINITAGFLSMFLWDWRL